MDDTARDSTPGRCGGQASYCYLVFTHRVHMVDQFTEKMMSGSVGYVKKFMKPMIIAAIFTFYVMKHHDICYNLSEDSIGLIRLFSFSYF